jgi:hypothetical protein
MEKPIEFKKIIGGTEQEKTELISSLHEAVNISGGELFGEVLKESNETEKEIITFSVKCANEIARKYGSDTETNSNRVFILERGGVGKLWEKVENGISHFPRQLIAVDHAGSNISLAATIFHESLHMNSYQASQIDDEGNHRPFRSGIEMNGRKGEGGYFSIAEEAIISILNEKFIKEVIPTDPLFEEDYKKSEKVRNWFVERLTKEQGNNQERLENGLNFLDNVIAFPGVDEAMKIINDTSIKEDNKKHLVQNLLLQFSTPRAVMFERRIEKAKFNEVLDRLVRESAGKIESKEMLFDMFARAHFQGNYLPLGKLIDGVFGVGSFRSISKELGSIKYDKN